eukprot:scaffold2663_cov353-Prasinococcus_capsulatus_cf.AAC.6
MADHAPRRSRQTNWRPAPPAAPLSQSLTPPTPSPPPLFWVAGLAARARGWPRTALAHRTAPHRIVSAGGCPPPHTASAAPAGGSAFARPQAQSGAGSRREKAPREAGSGAPPGRARNPAGPSPRARRPAGESGRFDLVSVPDRGSSGPRFDLRRRHAARTFSPSGCSCHGLSDCQSPAW